MEYVNKNVLEKLEAELKKSEEKRIRKISKKSAKRKTIQIRILEKWHKELKKERQEKKITMSKILDRILSRYFS